jgi:hypothetical protein
MPMVVGVFENLANAEDAVADLLASGYSRNNINLLIRQAETRRGHTVEPTERALATTLESAGVVPAAARFFADAICNGAVLVTVHCAAPRAGDARDILEVYNDCSGGPPTAQRHTLM